MGTGIDLARSIAPEHAAAIDDMKDQLLIVLFKRLRGGPLPLADAPIRIPIAEIADTGQDTLSFALDMERREFVFTLGKKS